MSGELKLLEMQRLTFAARGMDLIRAADSKTEKHGRQPKSLWHI